MTSEVVHCEERDRLAKAYRAAVSKNIEDIQTVKDMANPQWREATKETRDACQDAMDALNKHMKEHGCLKTSLPPLDRT